MRPETRLGALIVAAAAATMAASLSLAPLFAEQTWFWPTLIVVAAMAAVGYGARRSGLGAVAVHSGQLLALLWTATLLFAGGTTVLAVIPTPASMAALADLLREGIAIADATAPPVDALPAVVLLAAGGVGLVYLAVDLVAITARSPLAAGVPLLGLYAVAVITLERSISWPVFLLAAAGWLAMLVADGNRRLADWGVAVGSSGDAPRISGSLTAGGRRMGAAALLVALAVPALLPTPADRTAGWFGAGPGAGTSGGTVSTVNPYVDIQEALTRGENSEVLRYRTSDGAGTLLRLVTLDVYLADIWQQSPLQWPARQQAADGMPVLTGPAFDGDGFEIDVNVTGLDENRLPLPYPTSRVDVAGDWRYESTTQNVLSPADRTRGLQFRASAQRVAIDNAALEAETAVPLGYERYLTIPKTTPRVVTQTARDVTADAEGPFAQAVALQDWFRSEFDYDLDYVAGGGDPMAAFLADRRGYCQQFASTMALMARSLGIPARVNVGFASGTRGGDGWWQVTWHDTHAWPELFFPEAGWIPFEPTPRGGGGFEAPEYTAAVAAVPAVPTPTPSDAAGAAGHERLDPEPATDPAGLRESRGGAGGAGGAGAGAARWWLAALLVGAAVLVVPMLWRAVARRRRLRAARQGDVEAAWAEWRDTWVDLGGGWQMSWTPHQAAEATGSGLSSRGAALLQRLADAVAENRYAAVPTAAAPRLGPLLTEAIRGSSRRRRWRARLLPRSTWQAVGRGAEYSAAAVDRTERSLAGLTRR